jgi:hypothetical protein
LEDAGYNLDDLADEAVDDLDQWYADHPGEDAARAFGETGEVIEEGAGKWSQEFLDDALAGDIRSPQAHTDLAGWDEAMGMGNAVGKGRLSGYSEADIRHWYLDIEMQPGDSFLGELGFEGTMADLTPDHPVVQRALARYVQDVVTWEQRAGGGWTPAAGMPRPGKVVHGASPPPDPSVQPSFRTERLRDVETDTAFEVRARAGGVETVAVDTPPKGSRYYLNEDGTISRYKTQTTAAQTRKPDQWGWMEPSEYLFYDGAAAKVTAQGIEGLKLVPMRNADGIVDGKVFAVTDGRPIVLGKVYTEPRVGLHPVGRTADGRSHRGDRIVEVFGVAEEVAPSGSSIVPHRLQSQSSGRVDLENVTGNDMKSIPEELLPEGYEHGPQGPASFMPDENHYEPLFLDETDSEILDFLGVTHIDGKPRIRTVEDPPLTTLFPDSYESVEDWEVFD